MLSIFLKGFFVFVFLAAIETVHGILRARLVAPRVGDFRSRQIGVITGSLLIFGISYFTFPFFTFQHKNEALMLGFFWLVLMIGFEFTLGRFVFGFSWRWLLMEFAFWRGRLLAFGMFFLAMAPYIFGLIRGAW